MLRTTRHALLLGIALLPTLRSAGQTPSFRAGIDLIEVTAVVRDRDGTPIRDLRQADFQILERGIPQQIVAFDRVSIRTAPASSASRRRASDGCRASSCRRRAINCASPPARSAPASTGS